MLTTVLAPEVILTKALTDYVEAKDIAKAMQVFAKEDDVQWTMTHSFFADMGGFVVSYGGTESRGQLCFIL